MSNTNTQNTGKFQMQQPFWRLPVCREPPAAPNIPPRQPEKPFARADRFSGCFIFQAACTYQHRNNPCLPHTIYAIS